MCKSDAAIVECVCVWSVGVCGHCCVRAGPVCALLCVSVQASYVFVFFVLFLSSVR